MAISISLDGQAGAPVTYEQQLREAFDILVMSVRGAMRDDLECEIVTAPENLVRVCQGERVIWPGIYIRGGTGETRGTVALTFRPKPPAAAS